MDINEFRKDFIEDVKATAENTKDGTIASFVDVSANKLIDAEVLSDYQPAFYNGVGKRGRKCRIDGYSFEELDASITILVADYDGSEQAKTLIRTEADNIFARSRAFVEQALYENLTESVEISHPAFDLIETILNVTSQKNLRKIKIVLLTDKFVSGRIENLPIEEFNGIVVEKHIWDMSRFYRVCSSGNGRAVIEINLIEYNENGLQCIEASGLESKDYRCFLCVMPGKTLADIYDKYGSTLLEGNVRSFLSVRGKVNKAIRTSIINPEMAPLFFALNNGIAATASDITLKSREGATYLTHIKDLQIVNGGQTTASLSNARFKDRACLDGIFVQMKLTEVDSTLAENLIPQISRSSNSQNTVCDADFFSNHPFHIRMEKISRTQYAPAVGGAQHETRWFYERARGQYLQQQMKMKKSEKNKFLIQNPKNQVMTKTDLAKVRNTWSQLPHIVSKGSQANFLKFADIVSDRWDKKDSMFNSLYFQNSIALFILFKHVEKLLSKQTWYESGYRANIVTYSIALFSYLLKKRYSGHRLDLQKIWNKQVVPEVITKQMENITKLVFDSITDPKRETINVTQWCKREACWESVKKINIKLNSEIENLLISSEEVKDNIKSANKEQNMLKGIEAQLFIIDRGKEYWREMLFWATEKKLLFDEEKELLCMAMGMSAVKMPNAFQAGQLQQLRNRLMSEGYKSE